MLLGLYVMTRVGRSKDLIIVAKLQSNLLYV